MIDTVILTGLLVNILIYRLVDRYLNGLVGHNSAIFVISHVEGILHVENCVVVVSYELCTHNHIRVHSVRRLGGVFVLRLARVVTDDDVGIDSDLVVIVVANDLVLLGVVRLLGRTDELVLLVARPSFLHPKVDEPGPKLHLLGEATVLLPPVEMLHGTLDGVSVLFLGV